MTMRKAWVVPFVQCQPSQRSQSCLTPGMLHALFLIPGQPDCILEADPIPPPQDSTWRCWEVQILCSQQCAKCWP